MLTEQMWTEMQDMFGDRLVDSEHNPMQFAYQVKLFTYEQTLKKKEVVVTNE